FRHLGTSGRRFWPARWSLSTVPASLSVVGMRTAYTVQQVPWRSMKNKKTTGAGKAHTSAAGSQPGKAPGSARKSTKLPPWMPESLATPAKTGKGKPKDRAAPQSFVRGRRKPDPAAAFDDPYAAREAERYAQPIASREAILQLLERCEGPQNAEEIGAQLGLTEPDRADALAKRLGAMVRDGQLVQNRRGGFAPVL